MDTKKLETELREKVIEEQKCRLCDKRPPAVTLYTHDHKGYVCSRCVSTLYYKGTGSGRSDDLPCGQIVRGHKKVGANELCICGSGIKYKKCCR